MLENHTELRVRYAETDQMRVAYHANYLVWCEIGRTEFMRAIDLPYAKLEREGVYLAVSEARVRFHSAARYDDRVRVITRLSRVRSRAVDFDYVIENAGSGGLVARAHTRLVCLDGDGATRRLPRALRAALDRADDAGHGDGTLEPLEGCLDVRSEQKSSALDR